MVALGRDGISKGEGNALTKMIFKATYLKVLKKSQNAGVRPNTRV